MTVARLLQQGGYHTGMVGKWHLGSDPAGFDEWEILPGQGAYKDPLFYTATGEKTYTGQYATDVITDLALEFMKKRPRGQALFPDDAPQSTPSSLAAGRVSRGPASPTQRIPEPVTFWDSYATRTDALRENQQRVAADLTNRDLKLTPPAGAQRGRSLEMARHQAGLGRRLFAMEKASPSRARHWRGGSTNATCRTISRRSSPWTTASGRVLEFLDKAGLARNTMVVYTSDQGFFLGDHGLFDKRFMYEESIRMPFLVRWPARIAPGTKSDAIGLNIDFAPTFLDVAGLPPSADMQGRSLLPRSVAARPSDWRTSMYYRYYHDPGDHNTRAHYGVRTRTHKLIYFWKKDQWELFDLVNDPHELHNLYGETGQETLTLTLKNELARLKKEARDDDQLAGEQLPNGVDGPVAKLRGK